jgi:hypothetical protein
MNKKDLVLILILFISFNVFSKSRTFAYQSVHYGFCEFHGMKNDTSGVINGTDKIPLWNCDSLTIVQYMNKNVKDGLLANIKSGKIAFEIIIFDNGRMCCSSITNLTNIVLNLSVYSDAINNMPNWIPGKQNGIDAKCLISLVLDIYKGKFVDKKALPLTSAKPQ